VKVTGGGVAAAVLQRKATAIVNVARVNAPVSISFVIAMWRANSQNLAASTIGK